MNITRFAVTSVVHRAVLELLPSSTTIISYFSRGIVLVKNTFYAFQEQLGTIMRRDDYRERR